MLRAMSGQAPPVEIAATREDEGIARAAVWLDLEAPSEDERALAERASGLRLPSEAEVSEVEASSRLVQEGELLTLSMPMLTRGGSGGLRTTALGFVVSPHRLLTVRFAPSQTFDRFAGHWRANGTCGGMRPFLGLLEAMVDRMADALEQEGAALERLTSTIFSPAMADKSPRGRTVFLTATLAEIGRIGERVSHVRDALLGALRIIRFTRDAASAWAAEGEAPRLRTLERDIVSLNDYESQLINKVQFLLDATLGFINIEQANSVKVLTVVSLVGIPPTLVAGIYGMNFKYMPELNWEWGYPYGLALIVLSGVLPVIWFRWKGWL